MELLSFDSEGTPDSGVPGALQLRLTEIQPLRRVLDLRQSQAWLAGDPTEATKSSGAKADAESARLFGQYLGQIDARIDRAWLRPRTRIGADRFVCQVRIEQDDLGTVSSSPTHCSVRMSSNWVRARVVRHR
jgi:hypothetical protein